jgi:hypothetical protein
MFLENILQSVYQGGGKALLLEPSSSSILSTFPGVEGRGSSVSKRCQLCSVMLNVCMLQEPELSRCLPKYFQKWSGR